MDKVILVTSFASEKLILEYKDNHLFAIEKGIKKLSDLSLKAELAISDFDTYKINEFENSDIEIEKLPEEKDYSDTEYALIKARNLYPNKKIIILASLEKRYDHSHALLLLLKKYKNVILKDDHNSIYYFDEGKYILDKEDYTYLGAFGFPNCKISINGVYYKVNNLELSFLETKAISNSFTSSKVEVEIIKGGALIVLSKD